MSGNATTAGDIKSYKGQPTIIPEFAKKLNLYLKHTHTNVNEHNSPKSIVM